MTKITTKNRKFRCQNPGCNGLTDCPAWNEGKLHCQKCTVYRRVHGYLPNKDIIKDLKSIGRWKK